MVSVIQPYPQSKVKSSSSFVENEEKKLKRCNGTSPRGTKATSDIMNSVAAARLGTAPEHLACLPKPVETLILTGLALL